MFAGLGIKVPALSPPDREIAVDLIPDPPPPPPPPPPQQRRAKPQRAKPAPHPTATDPGGSNHPKTVAPPAPLATVASRTTAAPTGGSPGQGTGSGTGNGNGSGTGGANGSGNGGTDLEQIAGEIEQRDYPRDALRRSISGTVGVLFTVGVDGRVSRCAVTHSSGNRDLDDTTCRLIRERFRYRPSRDAAGRPFADEVEGEHVWSVDDSDR